MEVVCSTQRRMHAFGVYDRVQTLPGWSDACAVDRRQLVFWENPIEGRLELASLQDPHAATVQHFGLACPAGKVAGNQHAISGPLRQDLARRWSAFEIEAR